LSRLTFIFTLYKIGKDNKRVLYSRVGKHWRAVVYRWLWMIDLGSVFLSTRQLLTIDNFKNKAATSKMKLKANRNVW